MLRPTLLLTLLKLTLTTSGCCRLAASIATAPADFRFWNIYIREAANIIRHIMLHPQFTEESRYKFSLGHYMWTSENYEVLLQYIKPFYYHFTRAFEVKGYMVAKSGRSGVGTMLTHRPCVWYHGWRYHSNEKVAKYYVMHVIRALSSCVLLL